MRVTTLGTLAVDGVPVAGHRLATAVRALLDARGRTVTASSLIDEVWGPDAPRDAAGAVQALVSRARRLGLPIVGVPGGYRLPTDELSIDAEQAAALVVDARRALVAGDPGAARRHADAARGLLPAVPEPADEAVRSLLRGVAAIRAEAALAGASPDGGVDDEADLRRLVTGVPPDEPSAALLVQLLASRGREAEALEVVEALRHELRERYGADPSPVVAAAHTALLRGELGPAPVAAPPPGHGLPARGGGLPPGWWRATTPLCGREVDLVAVTAEMTSAPLVTIVGSGGAGKTRLAAEIARRSAAGGEPVRVVELAGVPGPGEAAGAVASVLHGGEPSRPSGAGTDGPLWSDADPVAAAARDLTGLVILDNCEHVLDAVARAAAQVLAVAPRATVLATSRAPLGLAGEVVYRLRALDDEDAVALLRDRARAGGATLAWPHHRALELCHRLDNLPLALELAAARLRHMPIEDVLTGFASRSGLRDEALRALPERHASLWSMVDWSHDLLSAAVRGLWRRLAPIPAPFTAELARAVGGPVDVRAGLATLVEQSLLSLGPGDDGVPRYRMLETVREYGEARLDASGERESAAAGLVAWAAGRAASLAEDFVGPAQAPAFAGCAADQDNLLAALRLSLGTGDDRSAVDIARALFHLWMVQGRHLDVVDWSARLLRVDDPPGRRASTIVNGSDAGPVLPHADRLAWTLLLVGINTTVLGTGRRRVAAVSRRALRRLLAERMRQVSPRAVALAAILIDVDLADLDAGMAMAHRLVAHADPLVQGFGLFLRSIVWESQGRDDPALEDNVEAYQRFETVGDRWAMGLAAHGIAGRLGAVGRGGSEEWLRRAAAHLQVVGAAEDARLVQLRLDAQLAMTGDMSAAARLAEAAAEPEPQTTTVARVALAELARRSGRGDEALDHVEGIIRAAEDSGWTTPQAAVMARLTAAVLRLGVPAPPGGDRFAAGQLVLARDEALATGDLQTIGAWALAGAEVAAHRGQDEAARELWALAVRLGTRVLYPFQEGYRYLPRLAEALGSDRESLVEPWRAQPLPAVTARARDLMATLLGS